MHHLKELFEQLIVKKPLSETQMQEVMTALMEGQLSDCQITAFLALMRSKGHTVEELSTAAQVMRSYSISVELGDHLVDIVGTGGDGLNTFNISTFSSFVVAGAGVSIAKHGNRSVSSNSGSSNLLDAAGISMSSNKAALQCQLKEANICFLFAPYFHPAMKYATTARRELGIRSLFNLLGPILNPALVKRQVVGVFSEQWLKPMSDVLISLGSTRHLVVHALDGMDEISVQSPTAIIEYKDGLQQHWQLEPQDYECGHSSLSELRVNSPKESLAIGLQVLSAKAGCAYDIVSLNAAAGIYCATDSISFSDALQQARESIDSGRALQSFHRLQQISFLEK